MFRKLLIFLITSLNASNNNTHLILNTDMEEFLKSTLKF